MVHYQQTFFIYRLGDKQIYFETPLSMTKHAWSLHEQIRPCVSIITELSHGLCSKCVIELTTVADIFCCYLFLLFFQVDAGIHDPHLVSIHVDQ